MNYIFYKKLSSRTKVLSPNFLLYIALAIYNKKLKLLVYI